MTAPRTLLERIRALERAAQPLEPDRAARRDLRTAVVELAERYLCGLGSAKAFAKDGDPGSGFLARPIAEDGASLETVLASLESEVIRPGAHPASGGHLAYLSGGGLYHSALAEYLAATINKFAGLSFTGPGPVRMENAVLRWTADLVGYPQGAGGSLASGGSLANLSAIVAAREAHGVEGSRASAAVVYSTAQTHHSIAKALRLAGLDAVRLREIPLDGGHRMRAGALERAIAADRAAGLQPWLIVATAGTTDAGAVDPLAAIADVAERERCWFHVDAAYGGFFLLTEHGRALLAGIERSDSVVLDPHKSLFLPWGVGIVLVRDVRTLIASHRETGHYLQDAVADPDAVSPADVSPELTKPFRALSLWLPLVLHGTGPFRAALDEKLLLARYFHERCRDAGFEVGPPPDLSVVVFRWAPPGASPAETDERNRAILAGVNRDGRVFLSSTTLDDRFVLRLAVLPFRTHLETIDLALEVLRDQLHRLSTECTPRAMASTGN